MRFLTKLFGFELASHGIEIGHVCKWMQKWLCGREQRVVINGTESKWVGFPSGVPQGSVLGQVLSMYTSMPLIMPLIP